MSRRLLEIIDENRQLTKEVAKLRAALEAAADSLDYHGCWSAMRDARDALKEGSTDVEWERGET